MCKIWSFVGTVLASLVLISCSSVPSSNPILGMDRSELPKVGEQYRTAKERLLSAGWTPIPAACSERRICFGEDIPELATDWDEGKNCARFVKLDMSLRVCVRLDSVTSFVVISTEVGA